ncbi:unnamed protein product [Prorocentrum cordatum]|uniref:Uncharacterized protein n=1 Tax=Prorocentrum cordatum TaxID=2364126 RepID=A0ABN9SUK4_9DINO|nr:unnamed protein product [Polarella glacialis]
MDQARNNVAYVREQLIVARAARCEFTSAGQHRRLGRCERAGGVWKELWRRACCGQRLAAEGDAELGAVETNKAKNSMMRRGGFAPVQWVFGRDVRIPGSLVDPLEASRLETHEAILPPGGAMAKQAARRDAARKAYIEVGNDCRMSIWFNCRGWQNLAAPEQLRSATPEDIIAWNIPRGAAVEAGAEHRARATNADARWRPTFPDETEESEELADAEDKLSEKSGAPIAAAPVPETGPTTMGIDDESELEDKHPNGQEGPDANAPDDKGPIADTEGESSTGEAKMRPLLPSEARDRLWIRFLTERSEEIEMARAAKAEGTPVSKTLEKQLGKNPKRLKGALDETKKKKSNKWCHCDAVEILTAKQVRELPRHVQAVPARFALTDNSEAMRADENKPPVKLKARLVVLGNLEKDSNYRRDAPTGSLLAQHMAVAWAASGGHRDGPARVVRNMDAKSAYLQGDVIDRELYLRPPSGGMFGVSLPEGSLLRANVPIYGSGDAARGWWKKDEVLNIQHCGNMIEQSSDGTVENGQKGSYFAEAVDWQNARVFVSTASARANVQDVVLQIGACSQPAKRVVGVMTPLDENGNTDKRVGIELAALNQLLARGGDELRWVDTSVMLADPLTKGDALDDQVLQRVLYSSEYNNNANTEMKEFRNRKAAMRRDLKVRRKADSVGVGTKQHAGPGEEQEAT